MCQAMLTEAQNQFPFHTVMIKGLFIQLLAGVLRLYQGNKLEDDNASSFSKPVRAALELPHLNQAANLQEVAEKVYMSKSHLAREFRRQVGMSMGRYVRALRLDQARYLLRETDLSVSAIAQQLQFASIQSSACHLSNTAAYRRRNIDGGVVPSHLLVHRPLKLSSDCVRFRRPTAPSRWRKSLKSRPSA